MPALNRIQLIGYLGKDPEVRYTPTGRKYCLFTLAVNRYWKDSDGERKDATDWFNIEARGRVEEICEQYLRKGRLVFLEGSVHTNRYEHEGETALLHQGRHLPGANARPVPTRRRGPGRRRGRADPGLTRPNRKKRFLQPSACTCLTGMASSCSIKSRRTSKPPCQNSAL
jgi:primosomal replication protein N